MVRTFIATNDDMKHIFLLGALFLFGATASAQSCTGASGSKAKTECTKSKSSCQGKSDAAKSCCQGKANAGKSCCQGKSSCTGKDKKGKKNKAKKSSGKEQGKQEMALNRLEVKSDKKAKMSSPKD